MRPTTSMNQNNCIEPVAPFPRNDCQMAESADSSMPPQFVPSFTIYIIHSEWKQILSNVHICPHHCSTEGIIQFVDLFFSSLSEKPSQLP